MDIVQQSREKTSDLEVIKELLYQKHNLPFVFEKCSLGTDLTVYMHKPHVVTYTEWRLS